MTLYQNAVLNHFKLIKKNVLAILKERISNRIKTLNYDYENYRVEWSTELKYWSIEAGINGPVVCHLNAPRSITPPPTKKCTHFITMHDDSIASSGLIVFW